MLHRVVRAVLPAAVALAVAFAVVPAGFAQEPPITVPADTGPDPSPDPVPEPEPAPPPSPPASSGGGTSPTPAVETTPTEPSGPTAAELRAQREREREQKEREREQKEAARERRHLLELRAQAERIWVDGLNAFGASGSADVATEPAATGPSAAEPTAEPVADVPTIEPEPAAQASAPPLAQAAGGSSSLSNAAPVLLGLLGLAVLLLGVAAIPPWTVRSNTFGELLATRRLEIGLIGAAVLASAAIGLVVAIVAGG